MASKSKCWKGRPHDWEDLDETETHILKQCIHCDGTRWIARRTIAEDEKVFHPIFQPPAMTM